MAFSETQLATLEAAISTGTKVVRYGDKQVEYHSMGEMLTLRDAMKRELDTTSNNRVTVLSYDN